MRPTIPLPKNHTTKNAIKIPPKNIYIKKIKKNAKNECARERRSYPGSNRGFGKMLCHLEDLDVIKIPRANRYTIEP
jgi:hypothetical protein